MTSIYLPEVKKFFPNLQPIACDKWSDLCNDYNCIAWAAEDTLNWWWPVLTRNVKPEYWPGEPRELTISAFVQAFDKLGYIVCDDPNFETGFTKVALYAKTSGQKKPTHMARQLPNGVWTSKLGQGPDIFHRTLECLEGSMYGTVAVILSKSNAS